MEFEALKLSFFDNVEFFSLIAFLDDEFSGIEVNLLESIYQLELLELVQVVEQLDAFQDAELELSFVHAGLDDDRFEQLPVQSVGLAVLQGCDCG